MIMNILTQAACQKFTKGDWSEVEIDADGNITSNRHKPFRVQKEHVSKMEKELVTFKPKPFAQNSITESDDFEIPQPTNKKDMGASHRTTMTLLKVIP
jgi:hypothetical protein